ncbi:MAG: polysaccharide biosynthesis C-terminal domain-containing protein [Pseudobutyrivibrio sp.]|nr:polysaccharide biosynthesis C-terminal domain-containing protein [Pseudobutyrivibrio sp.]
MKKHNSIIATTAILSVLTLCFKALGFVKQAVIAYYFGTTFETDIYNVAFNFVGMLSSAFIRSITLSIVSIYTHTLVQKGRDAASKLVSACLEILLPVVLVVLLFVYMLTPIIAKVLAPSYTPSQTLMLEHYLQICYPFFLFAVVTLIWTSIMDSNKDFVISRTESFITSTVTILSCIFLNSILHVSSLVVAQFCSYFIFAGLLLFRGRKYYKFTFTKISEVPEVKAVLLTALPIFIGGSVSQINKIVDNSISTGLAEGSATALSYAVSLEDFVCNVLINNVVDILYVNFANYIAAGDQKKLESTMRTAINTMICIMIPITITTCLCSREIVSIAYFRGNFDKASLAMTSAALIGYAVGFTSSGVRDVVIRVLYSFKDTKRPMITGIIAVCINIISSIILSRYIGIMGISIASSICLTVNFFINSYMIRRHMPNYTLLQFLPTLLKQIPGTIALVLIIFGIKHVFRSNLLIFMASALIGLSVYGIILLLMRIEEVDMLKNKLITKLRKD